MIFLQVPYNITGWLEKNKDPLNDTVVDQFKKGSNLLIHCIFADHPGQSGGKGDDAGGKGNEWTHTPSPPYIQHITASILQIHFQFISNNFFHWRILYVDQRN